MRTRVLAMVLLGLVVWAATGAAAAAAVWTQTTPGFFFPGFRGVAASGPGDVWAVGENDAEFETPVAERWDGSAWHLHLLALLRPNDGGLYGVAALAPTDAWAVGWQDTPGAGALAVRWDGSAWRLVRTPGLARVARVLEAMSALSRSNIWAVGGQNDGVQARTLAEHWNGVRWRVVPTPGVGDLTSVRAVGQHDVWAVGPGLVEHYDGTRWSIAARPVPQTTELRQIARVPGTTHLWAVGTDTTTNTPVAVFFDGSTWTVRNPPGAGGLGGVGALGPRDVWASGTGAGGAADYTAHWDGSAWARVSPHGLAAGAIAAMTRVPGSTRLWAVGFDGVTGGPFAAHR